jgi:hypothetical protein
VRQIVSILLLLLLAFNWVGFRIFSGYLEHNADLALEKKIEHSDYDESNLIEFRVPLNAPYLTGNSTEFERFDGEVKLNGQHYKYVKRKIENGELVLLCLPNESKTEIQNSREEFFKLVNDLNNSSQNKSKSTTSFKTFVTEYKQENNSWDIPSLMNILLKPSLASTPNLAAGFNFIPEQPPKA